MVLLAISCFIRIIFLLKIQALVTPISRMMVLFEDEGSPKGIWPVIGIDAPPLSCKSLKQSRSLRLEKLINNSGRPHESDLTTSAPHPTSDYFHIRRQYAQNVCPTIPEGIRWFSEGQFSRSETLKIYCTFIV